MLIFLRIIDVTVSQELLETPKLDDRVTYWHRLLWCFELPAL